MLEEEFSELIALAAIEAVDDQAMLLADAYAATSAELEQELAEMRMAVGAIPYGNVPLPVSSDLKSRLFDRIAAEESSAPAPTMLPFQAIRSEEMVWHPHPVPGLTISVLHTDSVTRQMSALIRCQPGSSYPVHRHAGIEEILMLEGDFICEDRIYGPGDYMLSGVGSIHNLIETRNGCLFFVRTSMDNEFLD